jgi:hypothetical protein
MCIGEWKQDAQVVTIVGNTNEGGGTHEYGGRWLVEVKKRYLNLC